MTTRRVVVVTHSAAPGGAELGLLRYLASGPPFDVTVVLLEDGPVAARLRDCGVRLVLPPRPGTVSALRTLTREVRRPDTVVVSATLRAATWVGLVRSRRTRHLLYLQDLLHGGYFGRAQLLVATLFTAPRADAIMVNSQTTRAGLPARLRRRARWVVHTPSGVRAGTEGAVDVHVPDLVRPLFLGRITPWKGPELFVEACDRVAAAAPGRVGGATMAGGSFFGEEEYRQRVRERAAAAALPIRLLDHSDDVAPLLSAATVLVHTSTTPEPFGQVVVQAMAHGLLVVAPDEGGPAEVLTHGETGLLYRRGDVDALTATLLAVAQDPAWAAAVARRGAASVNRFCDEQVFSRLDGAIAEFAGWPRPHSRVEVP